MPHVRGFQCDQCQDTSLQPFYQSPYEGSLPEGWVGVFTNHQNLNYVFCSWTCLKEFAKKKSDEEPSVGSSDGS